MQTFVVLLMAATFGARLASTMLVVYLCEGAMGLPVFANGAGVAYMAGPTREYLVGFLVAATLIGYLAERRYGRTLSTAFVAFTLGLVTIFALGVSWLSTLIGIEKAVAVGPVPFMPATPGDCVALMDKNPADERSRNRN
jgi:biotin transport system substrate-specific component